MGMCRIIPLHRHDFANFIGTGMSAHPYECAKSVDPVLMPPVALISVAKSTSLLILFSLELPSSRPAVLFTFLRCRNYSRELSHMRGSTAIAARNGSTSRCV
jgi:hypothetical protein